MAINDVGASVLSRLKNKARSTGKPLSLYLQLFCQEEFLRRVSMSKYASDLVLKGGMFIYTLTNFESRSTVDIDFLLRRLPNSVEEIQNVAEKFDALLQRLELTSRMKDFYDIYYLSSAFDFDGSKLQKAIYQTLTNRGTPYEKDSLDKVIALSRNSNIQTRWRQYLKRTRLPELPLEQVLDGIDAFLRPAWNAIFESGELIKKWSAGKSTWN